MPMATLPKQKRSAYAQLLRDPRWQRRRLDVLNAANWQCQDAECGRRDFPLEVHHCYYIYGRKPWDYPPDAFLSLCEDCHKKRQQLECEIKLQLMKCLRLVPICRMESVAWWMIDRALKESEGL